MGLDAAPLRARMRFEVGQKDCPAAATAGTDSCFYSGAILHGRDGRRSWAVK